MARQLSTSAGPSLVTTMGWREIRAIRRRWIELIRRSDLAQPDSVLYSKTWCNFHRRAKKPSIWRVWAGDK